MRWEALFCGFEVKFAVGKPSRNWYQYIFQQLKGRRRALILHRTCGGILFPKTQNTFGILNAKTSYNLENHYRDVNEKDGEYYRRWAAGYGPYTAKMIDTVLLSGQHEEQSYNSCNGILHMCTGQSKLLVEEAARLCVEGNACRYSYFKRCLKQLTNRSQTKEQQQLPSHENLRGKEIYK